MDAHDDLARLFRQVGAVSDGYREFDAPALPDLLPELPELPQASPPISLAEPGTPLTLGVLQPVGSHPKAQPIARGEAYARIAAARYGLPDASPG
ncbi:hypothetical protein [Leptothrix discophora]|uniref:Amidase n=1 Tax=Leptothrix discophora TaxID=89 RepID=A0ABT9G9A9_LEPDI|nr:hypothetical protein [Leptothrix discophora]MDP4302838.1 hypothetical protein [Leptothrix discophora]